MPDAAYYRAWRKAHPEYRARQNELRRKRRQERGREDRTREYARDQRLRRLRANGDHGQLSESSLIRKAHEVAASRLKPDLRTKVYDPRYEELVGEVVLALCEGRDANDAMLCHLKREWQWRFWCKQGVTLTGEPEP